MVKLMEDHEMSSYDNAGDSSLSGAGLASGQADGVGGAGSGRVITNPEKLQYSIPGVLHFIQHEWARFEMERAQWDVEKAELQARIAFLQGERKGLENLKKDLIRRIKMLEYALKQERSKYHKLKYGADLDMTELHGEGEVDIDEDEMEPSLVPNTNQNWRQGRELLRQYLQEIGYTDTILDVRSFRIRSLLGMNPLEGDASPDISLPQNTGPANNNNNNEKAFREHGQVNGSDKMEEIGANSGLAKPNCTELELADEEEEAMSNFDFLGEEKAGESGNREWNDVDQQKLSDLKELYRKEKEKQYKPSTKERKTDLRTLFETVDGSRSSGIPDKALLSEIDGEERAPIAAIYDNFNPDIGLSLKLDELSKLNDMNESDPLSYQISDNDDRDRTWSCQFTLKSHYDCVRALGFHPVEPVLITASEDCTLKLWNLHRSDASMGSSSPGSKKPVGVGELEPVYTFRGHRGPVLCLCMSPTGDMCYSGSLDGTIKCWSVPTPNIDPYDAFDPSILTATLKGHTDGVWSIALHSSDNRLLSAGADGSVRLWEPENSLDPMKQVFLSERDEGLPTSVDFVNTDPGQMLTAYESSGAFIFDIETGKSVLSFESREEHPCNSKGQINQIVSHPTLPITVTAHEDRFIRFFDNSSGKMIDCMVAHLDAVSCLSVDPNGLYLLSGSHDCSIRLWNLDNKRCNQEITAHRKKFDESIFSVAFHPSRPLLASAGADAIVKVFVC